MTKNIIIFLITLILAVLFIKPNFKPTTMTTQNNQPLSDKTATSTAQNKNEVTKVSPVPMIIDKTKKYQAVLNTSAGEITVDLFADKTPITVNNFVSLSQNNFYNNTIFHRVIKGFMIQGGDPKGDGTGGPGYSFPDEPFNGEYQRGIVAMANAGPNTNGSQFFIMHQNYDLPKNYVIFGKVVSGLDTVDKIAEASTIPNSNSGEGSKPVTTVSIKTVNIIKQ